MTEVQDSFADLLIDRKSLYPVFRQIVQRINCIIQIRQLAEGEPLPTIRSLAKQLGVNPNTVAKAYAELESAGVISKKRGSGCVVTALDPKLVSREIVSDLDIQIDELVTKAASLGVSVDRLMGLIAERYPSLPRRFPVNSPKKKKRSRAKAPQPLKTVPASVAADSETDTIWQPDEDFID